MGETPYTNTATVTAVDPKDNPAPEDSDSDGYRVERVAANCDTARASIESIWPANHKLVDIQIVNLTDTCGSVLVTIDGITQDEPVNDIGDGSTGPDAFGVGTDTAQLRAERSGTGDGRVYEISFTANAGTRGACSGTVQVGVPHDKKDTAVDSGQLYPST